MRIQDLVNPESETWDEKIRSGILDKHPSHCVDTEFTNCTQQTRP
jgi:hypothetical protein